MAATAARIKDPVTLASPFLGEQALLRKPIPWLGIHGKGRWHLETPRPVLASLGGVAWGETYLF